MKDKLSTPPPSPDRPGPRPLTSSSSCCLGSALPARRPVLTLRLTRPARARPGHALTRRSRTRTRSAGHHCEPATDAAEAAAPRHRSREQPATRRDGAVSLSPEDATGRLEAGTDAPPRVDDAAADDGRRCGVVTVTDAGGG